MVRSAQFIDSYFPVIDGVVHTVENYAKYLNRMGYCCVVAPKVKGYIDRDEFDVIRTAAFKVPKLGYSCALPKISHYKQEHIVQKVQLLHAHSPFSEGRSAIKMGKKYRLPTVATFHTKYYDDFLLATRSPRLAEKLTEHVVAFYDQADYVWAVNHATANTLMSYGYKGEIQVMPNGTDFAMPEDAPAWIRAAEEKFRLPQGKKRILFTGHLIWQKNLRLILETAACLKRRRRDLVFIFAGTGADEKAVRQLAETLGLQDCTLFIGQVKDRMQLAGLYGAADLFFFPSLYDNAPLVVREAAVMQLPALVAEGSNSAEGILDGKNGFTASPDKEAMCAKIEQLLENSQQLKQAGEEAARTIPIPWHVICSRVMEQYERIVKEFKENGAKN